MNLDLLFTVCTYGVIPFWLLPAVAPASTWTRRLVHSLLLPLLLGLVYLGILLGGAYAADGDFASLDGVRTAFADRRVVLLGWVHYLVFDLFVGAWIARDAVRRGIHRLAVAPCLLLTFLLGPSGLLAYLLLRYSLRGALSLDEVSEPAGP